MPDCFLLNAPSNAIHAVLVKNQLRRIDLIFGIECQDSVHSCEKEIAVAFREDFKLFLPGCLGEQATPLLGNMNREIRRELVSPDQSIQELRADVRSLADFRLAIWPVIFSCDTVHDLASQLSAAS